MARWTAPALILLTMAVAPGCTESSSASPAESEEVRIKKAQEELKELQRTGKAPANG